ncbi:MAG: ABC transporter ATP-binding protein [Lachnospiraceae bacterium]|nr:ABC transporter ATP-binding protein [Lachnospiraceae bacterium]
MNAITVRNLTKDYKNHRAVNDISFDVQEGEFFAFLGENGAGKSTTINILCTILEKTGGEAKIFGNELGKDDDEIRQSIGIVFQNSVLDGKLTVKENLFTRGAYYGLGRKEIMKRLDSFMDRFELGEIWGRNYEKLSGGQRRRVDIIRALLNKPRLLFLDEPTTGLDPMSRKIVWDYIDYLRKEKHMTIFLTTHYMEEVRDADHVIILDKGRIIANDTPAGLKNRYTGAKLLWYAGRNPDNDRLIRDFVYDYEADHYIVMLPKKEDFALTEFLYRNNDRIRDYEVIKGSMDDVFLNLTGRKLGE